MTTICKQCGIPDLKLTYSRETLPISHDNVCLFCEDYNETRKLYELDFQKNQQKFITLCDKVRGKNKYDVVVMYTGGKDSAYTAYYMKNVLNLNVLALTWDNGFFGQQHTGNLHGLIAKLGIDHKFISLGEDHLSQFYNNRVKNLGRFCACTQPALLFCAEEIAKSEATFIIMGVSFGQQLALLQNRLLFEFEPQQKRIIQNKIKQNGMGIYSFKDPGFFYGALLDVIHGDFSDSMIRVLKRNLAAFQQMKSQDRYVGILSLLFQYDHKTMIKTLSKYGWKKPEGTHEAGHTSCVMEPMKGYLAHKQNMLNLDYLELCTERRFGRVTEKQFDEVLPTLHFEDDEPEMMDLFLDVAKLSRDELYEVLSKKPFAEKTGPPINWDLVNQLTMGISKEQIERDVAMAYNRGIP